MTEGIPRCVVNKALQPQVGLQTNVTNPFLGSDALVHWKDIKVKLFELVKKGEKNWWRREKLMEEEEKKYGEQKNCEQEKKKWS